MSILKKIFSKLSSKRGEALIEYSLLFAFVVVILLGTLRVCLTKGFAGKFNAYKKIIMVPYPF